MKKFRNTLAALFTAAVLVFGTAVVATPAQGYALTSVKNTWTNTAAKNKYVYVYLDNGDVRKIAPQQTLWGVKSIWVQGGQCVSINGAPSKCNWQRIVLGVGPYTAKVTN